MAVRYQPNRNKWVVYTTLQQVDGVIHNTKRIHRLSTEKEMIPLAEAVMQTEAILEEWIPKEQLQGENYDLRVVCRESEIDYIVVRCSKGSITNLHLNNKAHWWNELSLPEVVRQQIYFHSETLQLFLHLLAQIIIAHIDKLQMSDLIHIIQQ